MEVVRNSAEGRRGRSDQDSPLWYLELADIKVVRFMTPSVVIASEEPISLCNSRWLGKNDGAILFGLLRWFRGRELTVSLLC